MAGKGVRPTRFQMWDALSTCQAQEMQRAGFTRQASGVSKATTASTLSF